MKILLYGGAFNPVHLAHINNIELACQHFSFDKIIIIPNRYAHFKEDACVVVQVVAGRRINPGVVHVVELHRHRAVRIDVVFAYLHVRAR